MIKRINFVEKKAFSFTYQKLMQICLVVILLNVAFVALQYYNASRLEKKLKAEQTKLTTLEAQRDSMMKQPTKQKISVGQYQDLLDKIEAAPRWSIILNEMGQNLPNTVWITDFKSVVSGGGAAATPGKGKKKKKGKKGEAEEPAETPVANTPPKTGIEVSGLGSDLRNITEFTSKMSQSEHFSNLVLTKSEKQTYGYNFTIKSEIKTNVR